MKTSDELEVGEVYTRAHLMERYDIIDSTINTGVFRPKGYDSVWLFVTEKKTPDRTQFQDKLAGDDLAWDGQSAGRTDDMIINHKSQGIELILFYRTEKYEHAGAGFTYEGRFEYVSHNGAKPAHFHLRREGPSTPSPMKLVLAKDAETIRLAVAEFNQNAGGHSQAALDLLSDAKYWVYDPDADQFAPSKFAAFDGMSWPTYEGALNFKRVFNRRVDSKFNGTMAQIGIGNALGQPFVVDNELAVQLRAWGEKLLGQGAFGNANLQARLFVRLPELPRSELEIVAADSATDALERSSGQGFNVSLKVRKAIEDYAMARASAHFVGQGYTVKDVSANQPYDLHCVRGAETLRVEVKGTQSKGGKVILTKGEVDLARRYSPATVLYIIHDITMSGDTSLPVAKGGIQRVIQPWIPSDVDLMPLTYMLNVPIKTKG